MANIVTITSNTSAIAPAIYISDNSAFYTIVGQFTYYAIGKILHITGSNYILKYDLTGDTATINGVAGLDARYAVVELNKQFIK